MRKKPPSDPFSSIRKILSENYDLGKLIRCRENTQGFVNIGYEIATSRKGKLNKYFVKKYKSGINKSEIQFEHSIINYLKEQKFNLIAGIIRTRDKNTFVRKIKNSNSSDFDKHEFYTVYEFLRGEDKYTWDRPNCNDKELKSTAITLAKYHLAIFDFKPEGKKNEPDVFNLINSTKEKLDKSIIKIGKNMFDKYFKENYEFIGEMLENSKNKIDQIKKIKFVKIPIHGDYHPANLKFQNDKVIGLFDFDWSRIDARVFDVALSIPYCCSNWSPKYDGTLNIRKVKLFLNQYQIFLKNSNYFKPLTKEETKYFRDFVIAANIFILRWIIDDYYSKNVDLKLYTRWLIHTIRLMRWFQKRDSLNELDKIINNALDI